MHAFQERATENNADAETVDQEAIIAKIKKKFANARGHASAIRQKLLDAMVVDGETTAHRNVSMSVM